MYGGTQMTKPRRAAALKHNNEMAQSEGQVVQNSRRTQNTGEKL